MKKKYIVAAACALCMAGKMQAQSSVLETGAANFLNITADARTAGMAGTGVALSGSNQSVYLNPAASLSEGNKRGGFTYTYAPWMRDAQKGFSLHSLGGFYQIDEDNAVLLGMRYFNYPKVNVSDAMDTFRPKEMAIEAAYARRIYKGLSAALALRYIYSDLGKGVEGAKTASAVAVDLSLFYQQLLDEEGDNFWNLGLKFSQLGSELKYLETKEKLPMRLQAGGALGLRLAEQHRVLLSTEVAYRMQPSDVSAVSASFGAEYTLADSFMFRGGYHYGDNQKADGSYGTVGAGFKRYGGSFDFAWLFADKECLYRNTFWLSLGYSF